MKLRYVLLAGALAASAVGLMACGSSFSCSDKGSCANDTAPDQATIVEMQKVVRKVLVGRTVTAYAVKRTGGEWSLVLINKDPSNAHAVKIEFADAHGQQAAHFSGPLTMVTFGAEQYHWHPEGAKSHADPDGPAARTTHSAKSGELVTLAKASVTVLRGKID